MIKNNAPNDNENPYFNFYGETEGYYLDENEWIYKDCYLSCKICKTNGNEKINNCLKCKEECTYEIITSPLYYKNYYKNYPFNNITSEINIITNIIEYLILNININNIDDGNYIIINVKNKQIIFTSTLNQKNNKEENNITLNLGHCENILKNKYNISKNDSLYILQIISEEFGMKIPKIEYEIYYPLYNINELTKLNLKFCQGTKIDISIPVKIEDQLDKYNSTSDYYNNICSKETSESRTDISLNDRRNEFVNNNLTICEEKCNLIEYNFTIEKAKCSCDIKTSISSYGDIKFNKNDFFKNFIDIKNLLNIKMLKCYKKVLKFKELKKNY